MGRSFYPPVRILETEPVSPLLQVPLRPETCGLPRTLRAYIVCFRQRCLNHLIEGFLAGGPAHPGPPARKSVPSNAPHSMGMVDSAATVLLLSAALLGALGLASVGLVATSELTIRFRRFRAARAMRAEMPARPPR
jgi:hypothetical protein